MKRGADLIAFAREHGLKIGTIADLIRHRFATERSVERIADQFVQTEYGEFRLVAFEDCVDHGVHFALVRGEIDREPPALVRVHIENALGDVLSVDGGTWHWSLRKALERIDREGRGVAVLLRTPHTAGDIIKQLCDLTLARGDEEEPQMQRVEDSRTVGIGSQILADLGVRQMRLLGAPRRYHGLAGFGLQIVEYIQY